MDEMLKSTDLTETAKFIAELSRQEANAYNEVKKSPVIVDLHGRKYLYANDELEEIAKPIEKPNMPSCFTAFTLDGLIEWIKADTDKLFAPDMPAAIVKVASPTKVLVISNAVGEGRLRYELGSCDYDAPRIPYNTYCDSEQLFVNIQTCFLPDENRDIVLRIVNNMTEEQSAQVSDDGISQRIMVKSGVQEVDKAIFKNPAYLRPMRTFTEVEQPESPFIVRFKEGKQAALFEADGGKWRVLAVRAIGKYLKEKLNGCNVVVIA